LCISRIFPIFEINLKKKTRTGIMSRDLQGFPAGAFDVKRRFAGAATWTKELGFGLKEKNCE
jgi:hypothetical protein